MESLSHLLRRLPPTVDAGLGAGIAWRLAAGAALAARSRPQPRLDGCWNVQVDDAETRRQLEAIAPELIAALNRMLGSGRVRRLVFAPPAERRHAD